MIEEKINHLKKSGAIFLPASNDRALELANASFQQMKASVMPSFVSDFYLKYGGVILGDAYVFPIEDADRSQRNYTIPGIVKINRDLAHLNLLRGKTIWGQNQFYFFSCDILGGLYIHDVLTLQILRKYTDFGAALSDCLLVGKI